MLGEAPKIEIDNIMEEIRETRLGMAFTFIDKKLSDITVSYHVDLLYNQIDIFNSDDTLSKLLAYDKNSSNIKERYVNFYELGLALGSFGTKKILEKKFGECFFFGFLSGYQIRHFVNIGGYSEILADSC